jgi:hypothetical protein
MTSNRRGFATFMVVATIPLVAMAILSLSMLIAADAKRTEFAHEDAQLQQFLLAANLTLLDQSHDWSDTPSDRTFVIPLPPSDATDAASARVQMTATNRAVTAQIQATYMNRQASERVHLTRSADGWHIVHVELNPAD